LLPFIVAILLLPIVGVEVVSAAETVTVRRLGGATRYATAAQVQKDSCSDVVIARGDLFPDALVSAYPAGVEFGCVFLTEPTRLPDATASRLEEYASDGAFRSVQIIGDESAVSASVQREVQSITGETVRRISGKDRYETAVAVYETYSWNPTFDVIVASGETFADAMAAGPVSYAEQIPLLLTPRDSLPPSTSRYLGGKRLVLIVGGTNAVSAETEVQIRTAAGPNAEVVRLAGRDRTETAVAVAEFAADRLPFTQDPDFAWDFDHVNLARGDNFPDALAGGPHSGQERAPVLFTANPSVIGQHTRKFLEEHAAEITSLDVFGSETAVSRAVVDEAAAAAS